MFKVTLYSSLSASLVFLAAAPSIHAADSPSSRILAIEDLGKGAVPLDGAWQFHLGDNLAWAQPQTPDTTGINGWEQLSVDSTWGDQTHPAYVGYAWYRRHLHLRPAHGGSADFALMIPHIDDVYEIYWNGMQVARHGTMPPNASFPTDPPPQTFEVGSIRDGVLAVRVWKEPLFSHQSDRLGGFVSAPLIGSPAAIADAKAHSDYMWLRSRQYYFGLHALDGLVMIISLLVWLRDRSQHLLLAMAAYSGSWVAALFLVGLRIPFSFNFSLGWLQPVLSITSVSLWYLLLHLLKLDSKPRLVRFTRILMVVYLADMWLDGLTAAFDWSNPSVSSWVVSADGLLTALNTAIDFYPLVLVGIALKSKLDPARWLVAGAAFLDGMILIIRIGFTQGSRFTHLTIADKIATPVFSIYGSDFTLQTIADTLLLIAVVYATARYVQESARRQSTLQQEYKSAREVQQVLIPKELPSLPGFALTSAYRPAQEVGGDFFQVIPLEGQAIGSTLIILGDVSGKGLRAAMTVSLIVGAVRTVARFLHRPAAILSELNVRLDGRMKGGFVTCLALLVQQDGLCSIATAGHPAPYLNDHEIDLPGALPLGLLAAATYEEITIHLRGGDYIALYTDGLLEARKGNGEIFSFERLGVLLSNQPSAALAAEAAVDFGQDDDITVLTLTRLAHSERSASTHLVAPALN